MVPPRRRARFEAGAADHAEYGMSAMRGYGGHRACLPWVSVHHLWSIVGVEQLGPGVLKELESG